MKSVYVIILNWNGKDDTLECLLSLGRLRVPSDFKVRFVVVDNASTDGSVSAVGKLKLKNIVKVLVNGENLGFAGGNNVGISYALKNKADYIMVINNDTFVDRDLLKNFLKAALGHKDFGILSPKIYFAKGFEFHKERYKPKDLGKVIWYAGGEIDWNNVYGKNRGVDEVDRGQFDQLKDIDFATGACSFFSSEALSKVGGYDERYFMYFEDDDLSFRMKKAGFGVYFVSSAIVWHKVSRSSGIGGTLSDYYIIRNRLLFGMRYAPLRAKLALLRESMRIAAYGSTWQKRGAIDFYLRRFGRGSYRNEA